MINVVAGVLRDQDKIFIAQRPKDKHQALKWEFPGGKVEQNETDEQALKREFMEEMGIEIIVDNFICEVIHNYPTMDVKIRAYFISTESQNIQSLEHESVKWVSLDEVKQYDLVAADISIVDKILEL